MNEETLEEKKIRGREALINAGGKEFIIKTCMNKNEIIIDLLEDIIININ